MSTVSAAPVAARREVLARLRRRADEALRGAGGLVVITGEAGIGKTILLADLAAHARGRAQVGCDAVTTGTFCTYSPSSPVRWRF